MNCGATRAQANRIYKTSRLKLLHSGETEKMLKTVDAMMMMMML